MLDDSEFEKLKKLIGKRVRAKKDGFAFEGVLGGPLEDQNSPLRRNAWFMRTDDGLDTPIVAKDYEITELEV